MDTGLLLGEDGIFDEVEAKVTSTDQIHDQVEVISVLKRIEGVDKELVLETF